MTTVRMSLVAAIVCAIAAACSGGAGDATPEPTVAGSATATTTASTTATPTADDGHPLPMAAEPEPPANAAAIASGARRAEVAPGSSFGVDLVDLAVEESGSAPPCAALVASLTWAAAAGGTPERGVVITATRMNSGTEVGRGAEGALTSGCAFLSFANTSAQQVDLEVRFVISTLE